MKQVIIKILKFILKIIVKILKCIFILPCMISYRALTYNYEGIEEEAENFWK